MRRKLLTSFLVIIFGTNLLLVDHYSNFLAKTLVSQVSSSIIDYTSNADNKYDGVNYSFIREDDVDYKFNPMDQRQDTQIMFDDIQNDADNIKK